MNLSSRAVSWVFPVALAVIMGAVTFWLNRVTDVNIESVLLNPAKPQYVMTDLNGVRFNAEGQKAEVLQARSAHMFPNNTDVIIHQPNGQVFKEGKELYRVKSEQARYSDVKEKVFFDQEVTFTKAALDGKPAGVVTTSQLEIDLPTQVASTKAQVEYQYGESKGSALGFSYDNKNEVLNLDSRVKAIIYDQP